MLQIHLVLVTVPTPIGVVKSWHNTPGVYIRHGAVDTVTPVDSQRRTMDELPDNVRAVIRYLDGMSGYRLMYVANTAQEIAVAVRREYRGEDSDGPDFSRMG
jgi:hypothetical protein